MQILVLMHTHTPVDEEEKDLFQEKGRRAAALTEALIAPY